MAKVLKIIIFCFCLLSLGSEASGVDFRIKGWWQGSFQLNVQDIDNLQLPVYLSNNLHDVDLAGLTASYQFNDNLGINLLLARPFKNNANNNEEISFNNDNIFALALPMQTSNLHFLPWGSYGLYTQKFMTLNQLKERPETELNLFNIRQNDKDRQIAEKFYRLTAKNNQYPQIYEFWLIGLPFNFTALNPLNVEFDFAYGSLETLGRHSSPSKTYQYNQMQYFETKREGWLAKFLLEYKSTSAIPGFFLWYGSGDDDNFKNGSERLPNFNTTDIFNNMLNSIGKNSNFANLKMPLDGTWGLGLQLRDFSFTNDLTHTLRIAYYNGTNDPKMVHYTNQFNNHNSNINYNNALNPYDLYLTNKDQLVEVDLNTVYKMYDNLSIGLQLSYLIAKMDKETWSNSKHLNNDDLSNRDAWTADIVFMYSF